MSPIQNPIKRLPVKGSKSFASLRVVPLTLYHVDVWMHQIQPVINRNYCSAITDPKGRVRADIGWDWYRIWDLASIHDLAFMGRTHRKTLRLCVVAVPDKPNVTEYDYFPVGMLTLVPKFRCNAPKEGDRAFTWFLSNAPKETYDQYLKGKRIEGVAKMLLDCVVQSAYDIDGSGEMLLRAATEGGKHLRKFYAECRLRQLKYSNGRITFFRRKYPEEYFMLSKANAKILSRCGDPLRE
ncbi:hypothetical protein D3C77_364270 [compost metagenome]